MPSMRGRAPKGTGTARVGGAQARAPLHGARGLGHLVWFGSRGPARAGRFAAPTGHLSTVFPTRNRHLFPSNPSITYLALRKHPICAYALLRFCRWDTWCLGHRIAVAAAALGVSSPTPTDTLRRNTSRAQRCRRAKPGYTWSPRKNR